MKGVSWLVNWLVRGMGEGRWKMEDGIVMMEKRKKEVGGCVWRVE